MKDIQAIARYMRLPEDQLKFPIELLNQGYEPNYLANYRPDELGSIDEQTLSILQRALIYSEALKHHKEKVQQTLEREQHWNETVASVVSQSNTISQVDTVTRQLRARRNSRSVVEACPQVEIIGQAILTLQGDAPKDMIAWTAETASVPLEQAEEVLNNTKRWMVHLLSEDVRLIQDLQRTLLKKASISVKILPDPPKGSDAERRLDQSEASVPSASADPLPPIVVSAVSEPSVASEVVSSDLSNVSAPFDSSTTSDTSPVVSDGVVLDGVEANDAGSDQALLDDSAVSVGSAVSLASPAQDSSPIEVASPEVAPLIAGFNQGRKQPKAVKTKSLSEKQLSPRQRRRRWLRSILESYARLKKPVAQLTPYQILMLSRGQRSQIIAVNFHYDERPLVQVCRESLCPGRHPMHHWLVEVAEEGLRSYILPRLHQDVFSILEEDAHTDLTEAAVIHLQSSLLQRPVRGHRILVVDAIGPKMAAVVIVDADGSVLFTDEIPCNSNRADVVAQNVVTLGQWIHEHKVTLLALSNGPSRRYLIHTVSELLKQSAEGSLYWTMVDRAGADGYCMSRGCLVELPRISRRHRAATWLAWRMQDPLKQILKVEPARLRLGSYQRELPQRELETALKDAVSAAITKAGVDVFHADAETLKRLPGMSADAAKAIVKACEEDKVQSRESIMTVLREHLTEMQARQAIGFLKVYGSPNPLDGTTIHPDDYRLAERLIEHANLTLPTNAPENWSKPDYAKLAAATAAASIEHAKQIVDQPFAASLDSDAEHPGESLDTPGFVLPSELDEADTTDSTISSDGLDASVTVETVADPVAAVTVDDAKGETSETSGVISEDLSGTGGAPKGFTPAHMPIVPVGPLERPTLTIDVERLARSWQVGREKMKRVANCLQFSFADNRDFQFPVPIQSKVPRLDSLVSGSMLQAMVVGVADFGVFVDLGPECSGLIHISRLAPDFIEDPHQFVQVGDLISVWVLNVDEKKKRVSLTAIPPGTPTRREQQEAANAERSSQQPRNDRDRNQGANRNDGARGDGARNDRGPRPQSTTGSANSGSSGGGGNNRSGDNRSTGNRPTSSTGDRSNSNRGNDSRSGGNRNSRPGGRDGNRGRNDSYANDSGSRRPARVEPPKPVTPISDAMQQGKEPLRSFSDLLQFMKQPKDETTVETTVEPKSEQVVAPKAQADSLPSVPQHPLNVTTESVQPANDNGENAAPTA
jgi:protein Tex